MTTMLTYQARIREALARLGRVDLLSRAHEVEAWMRSEHSTLDGLSAQRFAAEVRVSAECVDVSGPIVSASVAASYGCLPESPR